jgi:dihydrofolate reductase
MRKLKLQMQVTLDGFVAGPNGELDWMSVDMSPDNKAFVVVNELVNTSDVILMGRGMAHEFTTYWENVVDTQPDSPEYEFAKVMVGMPKIAFSKTVDTLPGRNLRVENGDLTEKVTELKNEEGKDILVYGGARFVSSLIEHGLIDEFNLFVNPVAIGAGKRIFTGRTKLQLIVSQPNPNGIVINTYIPAKN